MIRVPNQAPTTPHAVRVALVGEAPGEHEEVKGRPFVGPAGSFLWDSLRDIGLTRDQVWVGNVCQYRPPNNKLALWSWDGPEIQDGLTRLRADLTAFKPQIVVALGSAALRALVGEPRSIDNWKNTVVEVVVCGARVKCLPMYHPAACLHDRPNSFFFHFQVERLGKLIAAPDAPWVPTPRNIQVHTDPAKAVEALASLHSRRLAFDIEGYARTGVTCFSLAPSATEAHVFPVGATGIYGEHGGRVWSAFEALVKSVTLEEYWRRPASRMFDAVKVGISNASHTTPATPYDVPLPPPKGFILHNSLYDAFVLAYSRGLYIQNAIADDTLVLWWELFSEVAKRLADLTSCLTTEPFYKHEREDKDPMTRWVYCGKDSAVTFECCEKLYQRPELTPPAFLHYAFNMSLLAPILYMELRGLRFDDEARARYLSQAQRRVWVMQDKLNQLTGRSLPTTSEAILTYVKQNLCVKKPRRYSEVPWVPKSGPRKGQALTKRESTPVEITTLAEASEFALAGSRGTVDELVAMLGSGGGSGLQLACSRRGRLSTLLGLHFNVNGREANPFLYETLKLPPVFKKENGRLTDRLTHDSDALLSLYLKATKEAAHAHAAPVLKLWLRLASALTSLETLAKRPDVDGRMRCAYNSLKADDKGAALTKSGRFTCSESAAGVGYNLQTVTKSQRNMFLADPGCELGQSDLKAADGWTIACECAALGDERMLEDVKAGVKQAQIVTLLLEHGAEVNEWPMDEIKKACKALPKDWRYLASKRIIWGTAYLMGLIKMSEQILSDSFYDGGGLTFVSPQQCRLVQQAVHLRYPGLRLRQKAIAEEVLREGCLHLTGGHCRRFFGRRWEWVESGIDGQRIPELRRDVHGDALAEAPQLVTTMATKLALWRLYYDKENRIDKAPQVVTLHT